MIKSLLDGCVAVNAGTAVNFVMCINGFLVLIIIGAFTTRGKLQSPEGVSPGCVVVVCIAFIFICTYYGLVTPSYIPPGTPMPTDCSYIITF